jgi:hypothetical protein
MSTDTLYWIIGTPIIIALAVNAVIRARKLSKAIREHLEEEQTGVKDPYAQMAALMAVRDAIEKEKKHKR